MRSRVLLNAVTAGGIAVHSAAHLSRQCCPIERRISSCERGISVMVGNVSADFGQFVCLFIALDSDMARYPLQNNLGLWESNQFSAYPTDSIMRRDCQVLECSYCAEGICVYCIIFWPSGDKLYCTVYCIQLYCEDGRIIMKSC